MKNIFKWVFVLLILMILILLYSRYLGIKGLKVKEFKVEAPTISENYHGIKIVHFSDLYYGSTITKENLINIVNKINFIKPDIVIFTGNLISNKFNKEDLINSLNQIKATIGKYYITGINDNIEVENIFSLTDFININDNYELIYNSNDPIIISGISSANFELGLKTEKFDKFIGSQTDYNISYSILLINEADYIDKIDISNYDLILAGNSLGGNINLPLINQLFLPQNSKKYSTDHYSVESSDLFVNTGLGTTKSKLRLFNKPSINFYRIMK